MIGGLVRFWHTVRWLRPVQLWGRLWFRLYRPGPDLRPAPPLRSVEGRWLACARAPSMSGPTSFRFLSVDRTVAGAEDWNRTDWPRLWLYNLHYFDDLVADGAAARAEWHRALVSRWIAENPAGQGNGWEPYPTSLRIVNWVKWSLAGNALDSETVASLAQQARWLRKRLEIHLLGNHFWANAKALVFAGTFFEGAEATGWRETGLRLLRRELAEQVLRDGGHFERSPMYHAIVLGDVLDLLQLAQHCPACSDVGDVEAWRNTATRMRRWLRVMTHPDGGIAFFNDAALGIAPDLAALADYADALFEISLTELQPYPHPNPLPPERERGFSPSQLESKDRGSSPSQLESRDRGFSPSPPETGERAGVRGRSTAKLPGNFAMFNSLPPDAAPLAGIEALPDSGYVRLQIGPAVLIADVGAIGPEYLPGHAHADTLSFELSLHGRRVLVNSGTSTYEAGDERLRQRGTAAHNTVIVDGHDSSEVWSSFRVARRARPFDVQWEKDGDAYRLEAAHDGYLRLPGRVVHRRSWRLSADRLEIADVLEGRWRSAMSCWHVHPEFQVSAREHDILLLDGRTSTATLSVDNGAFDLSQDTWHPEFGTSILNTTIRLPIHGPRSVVTIAWS
ncbi:MAG: alginate lyase family protein [Burkholderiales bacterium]